jgi:Domain of unknown function (DUF202)
MTTAPLADPPAMPSAPPGGVRGWLRRARAVVWGAGPPPAPPATTDRGTLLAEQRTEYAAQRTYLAAERTLMAWIRTSLSMISFGFTIVKVFEYVAAERKLPPGWFGTSGARRHSVSPRSQSARWPWSSPSSSTGRRSGSSTRGVWRRGGAWR